MGNKCSLCMNCKFKETDNFMPPCYVCKDCSEFDNYLSETKKVSYEKIFDLKMPRKLRNMDWIADFADIIGYDPLIVNIKKIIFSGPATIVLWQGGGKTIVKYHKEKGCAYRKDLGVLYCIIKHYICLDNAKLFHKLLKTIDEFCEAENGNKTT